MNDIIYGSLLGDGSIYLDKVTPKFVMAHGTGQLDYLIWKSKLIGISKTPIKYITGFGSEAWKLTYYNKDILHEIYNTCVVNKIKTVTTKWLDNCTIRSLAIWYQDDGSWLKCGPRLKSGDRAQRYVIFSTCGFSYEENEILQNWLKTKFDLNAKIIKHKSKYYALKLYQESVIKLWNLIAPYLFLKYKVDLDIKPTLKQCKCGNWMHCSFSECDNCIHKNRYEIPRYKLYRRFNTTSLEKIKPLYKEPELYWFNKSLLTTF